MPVWVVTGGSGFLGSHLLAKLSTEPAEVVAVGRRCPADWSGRFVRADFADSAAVDRLVKELRPSVVFHLAGQTPPATAAEFDQGNTRATIHWLDALRSLDQPIRVLVAGSASELGPVPGVDLPVAETWPCQPTDPYAVSKYRATLAALAARPPLEVMVARVFNPIGPGLPASQALGRFARALAAGAGDLTLTVGDLTASRDFIDVRDVAEAFLALATRGVPGRVYHVGTGQSHPVSAGLERLITLSGRRVTIELDPTFPRPAGPSDSRADISLIQTTTGWSPVIPWEQSLSDLWSWALQDASKLRPTTRDIA